MSRDTRGESIRAMYPLFQGGEGGSIPTSPLSARALVIERIPFDDARELNLLWHSRLPRFGTGFIKSQPFPCFAAWHGGRIYAVAIWSNPIARLLPQKEWYELRRLAAAPDAPRNTCSRMLRIMGILLGRSHPHLTRFISYQDMDAHSGTIYKAAGWKKAACSDGGEWDRLGRRRAKVQSRSPKCRWEKVLS